MRKKIFKIIENIFLCFLKRTAEKDIVLVRMSTEEYLEYLEFKNNVFIVYETEQELKNDWPDAKQIIKK